VSPEQLREVARKYLRDVRWGIVGPEALDKSVFEAPEAK
jgi:hypothetical protein